MEARLTLTQKVPGSKPGRPANIFHAPVVQRTRTLGYEPRDSGFKSLRAHHFSAASLS
ncbi:hypothetical protein SBA4_1900026 [Candidatus Sulfopaludibacter sp. SbA4]|nr:hypothetical protein SBA4_1900026 [Candidatus Sulfopaludibacter sp. SbA4]